MLEKIENIGRRLNEFGGKISDIGSRLQIVAIELKTEHLKTDLDIIRDWWFLQNAYLSNPDTKNEFIQELTQRGLYVFQRARGITETPFTMIEIAPGILLFENGQIVNEYAHTTTDDAELSSTIKDYRAKNLVLSLDTKR